MVHARLDIHPLMTRHPINLWVASPPQPAHNQTMMSNQHLNTSTPGHPRRMAALLGALVAALGILTLILSGSTFGGCSGGASPHPGSFSFSADETAFIDELQHRTFLFFWEQCHPVTGLAPDRAPTRSFASISATGFALTTYPIGVERGYVTRDQAARRVLRTLRFFATAPMGQDPSQDAGTHGFFYHFVHMDTGLRFDKVELSTIDTAQLMAGALFCQTYFDGANAREDSIRTLAEQLYRAVDWQWASPRAPMVGHGWGPEHGHLPYDYGGYTEAALLYIMALGSPTFPVRPEAWDTFTAGYRWEDFYGFEHINFAPLFGHQFSHCWIDFRGIRDEYCREKGIDYFENSRRAALGQRAYAMANPGGFRGYGRRLWGLTACDGPVHGRFEIEGTERLFHTYWARGAAATEVHDDGTICPSASAASIAFAPEVVVPTLMAMRRAVQHGRVVPGVGWYDTDYLGIDQGPIVIMIENLRSGLVWNTLRRNPHITRGLKRAGFTGGWLDEVTERP